MTNKQKPNSNLNSESNIRLLVVQERLRQAYYSFNLALAATAISFCVGFIGSGLLLSGKVAEGTVTSAAGLVSGVRCLKFANDANDRLDEILEESDKDD